MTAVETEDGFSFKLITFNILAPCYKRLPPSPSAASSTASSTPTPRVYESEQPALYMQRNQKICKQLLETKADVICLQEFWSGGSDLVELYQQSFQQAGYAMKTLPRTSHWRSRTDSLVIFVKLGTFQIEDIQEILFHDCGDRVALMMLLAYQPVTNPNIPPQRLICINTHLLFPHNPYSSKIRLREVTKILGFVDSYKQRELCTTLCGRSDVKLPVIITGDFNGSPRGHVYQFMKSQNFQSAAENFLLSPQQQRQGYSNQAIIPPTSPTTSATSTSPPNQTIPTSPTTSASPTTTTSTGKVPWISHRNHLNQTVFVDHVFFSNPSDQIEEKLPAILPDWTNLVFRELMQKIVTEYGGNSLRDVFSIFDQDHSNYISNAEFAAALNRLGFQGENTPSLTNEEIDVLVKSADKNADGMIDYKEFYDRFWLASEMMSNAIDRNGQVLDMPSILTNETTISSLDGDEAIITEGRDKHMGLMLNSKRMYFPRSTWLSTPSEGDAEAVGDSSSATATTPEASRNIVRSIDRLPTSIQPLPQAQSCGDLIVQEVSIKPLALQQGIWPEDYTISDHGMLECIFMARFNTNPKVDVVNVNNTTSSIIDVNNV